MAATSITPVEMGFNTLKDFPTLAAGDITDGALVPATYEDRRTLIIAENTSEDTAYDLTIYKGNGIQAARADLVQELAFGDIVVFQPESGLYKQMTGDNKGYFHIGVENAAIKIGAIIIN